MGLIQDVKSNDPAGNPTPTLWPDPQDFFAKCGLNMQKRIWWTSVGAVSFFEENAFPVHINALLPYMVRLICLRTLARKTHQDGCWLRLLCHPEREGWKAEKFGSLQEGN